MRYFSDKNSLFWLITILAAIILLLPNALSKGIFIDGLYYGNMARNMAEGRGSFWAPFNTLTVNPQFFDHPPLGIGIESLAFRIFGDSYLIEKLYSLFTFVIIGFLIVKIWQISGNEKRTAWLPLLLWIITPLVYWEYVNNLLEDTMSVFCIGSCALLLASFRSKGSITGYSILAGLLVFAGILTKGPFALFPLALPFLYWLTVKEISLKNSFISTTILIVIPAIGILLFWQWPAAKLNLDTYLHTQLLSSLKGERDQASMVNHFTILNELFLNQLIPILMFSVLLIGYQLLRHLRISLKPKVNHSFFFLLVALSASLPVMVSPKQMIHYVLCSIPFFALGAAIYLQPIVLCLIDRINTKKKNYKILAISMTVLIISSLVYSFSRIGTIGRDREILSSLEKIKPVLPKDQLINCDTKTFYNWQLNIYLYRFYHISLDYKQNASAYYFEENKGMPAPPGKSATLIGQSGNFYLFKRE